METITIKEKKKLLNFLNNIALKTDCYTVTRIAKDYIELYMLFGDDFYDITISEEFYFNEYEKWRDSYKESIKNQVKECISRYNETIHPSETTYKIFKDYDEFLKREDKKINGYSQEFIDKIGEYKFNNIITNDDFITNEGCWNCSYCCNCRDCVKCKSCSYCVGCDYCESCYNSKGLYLMQRESSLCCNKIKR